jgi:hypothetical protein
MRTFRLGAVTAAVLGLAYMAATPARASIIVGSAYLNQTSIAGDAVVSSETSLPSTPSATFTVPSPTNSACGGSLFTGDTLCFDSGYYNSGPDNTGGAYTLGGFLSSGGATILTGSPANLAANLDNTVFVFKGTVSVTNDEFFTAGHDDGLQLMIDGYDVIDAPFGTSYAVTSEEYTGPTGTFAFNLIYGECCGPPAALGISLPFVSAPPSVPEPLTLSVFGVGVVGAAALSRRRRKVSKQA